MAEPIVLVPGTLVDDPSRPGVVTVQDGGSLESVELQTLGLIGSASDCQVCIPEAAPRHVLVERTPGGSALTVLADRVRARCRALDIVTRDDGLDVYAASSDSPEPLERRVATFRERILSHARTLPGGIVRTPRGDRPSAWIWNVLGRFVEAGGESDAGLDVEPTEIWVAESDLQGETVLQEGATIELLGLAETILVFERVAVAVEYDDDELTCGIW